MSRGTWRVNEDGTFTCVSRITGLAGSLITQASVSSIALVVAQQDADDETEADDATAFTATPVVSSVVFDTAQTSEVLWPSTEHPDGYNFRCTIPGSAVPLGGVYYDAIFTLTMAAATDHYGNSTQAVIKVPFRGIYTEPNIAD